MEGYVRLHREIINNPIFKKPLINHLFVYCLLRANHKDNKMVFNCQEIEVERGSFICGRKKLSEATGETEQNVRSALRTLQNLGMLQISTTKSTSKYSYITVCNYNDYQYNGDEGNQQTNHEPTSNQPASNQQATTDNNDNNILNDSNVDNNPPKSPQGEIVFPEWLDQEMWKAFVEHRKGNRKKITPRAMELIFKSLGEAKAQGQDPNKILETSIINGWQGIFPDKSKPTPKPPATPEPNRIPPKEPDLKNHRTLVRKELSYIKTREDAANYYKSLGDYLKLDPEVQQMFERFM